MIAEFRWLPNSLTKNIILPNIYYKANSETYSGKYTWYEDFSKPSGYITLVESEYDEDFTIESTIAHEFMHHIQYINKKIIKNTFYPNSWGYGKKYEDNISKYFTLNICEYEALLFENKIAKCAINEYRLRKIVWKK